MRSRVITLLLVAAPLIAEGPPARLSLVQAVDAAVAGDPAVAAAQAGLAAARAALGEAESTLQPHLDLSGSAVRYEEPMVVTPIHGFTPGQFPEFDETLLQSALSASYLLYDGGAGRARIRQARAGEAVAAAVLEAARAAIAARVATLYLAVLSRASSVQAHDLRAVALQAELDRVGKLRQVGRAADVEVLRVEAALAAAAAERTGAAADLEVAERSLSRSAGLPLDRTRAANLVGARFDSSFIPERQQLEKLASESNPDLHQARERLRVQRAAVSFARAGKYPRLQTVGSLLQFGSGEGDFTTEWNAGLQLRWSLFDGGATRARVAQASALAERAEQQVREIEREVREATDRALADLDRERATAESLETAVARFSEVARIEKLRLETGVGIQTDYLRAVADLMQARAGLAAARYRSMIAMVELARIAGQLDGTWLRQMFGGKP